MDRFGHGGPRLANATEGSILKIAHVIPSYYPALRYGGPVLAVHDLCRHLVARGNEVSVFTTNADGEGSLSLEAGGVKNVEGVGVQYFGLRQPRRLYYSPDLAHELEKRIAEFDVVHLHSTFLYPTLKAARCATKRGVPYVLAPRGMLVKDLINRKNTVLKRAWIALFERKTIEQAAALHVTSALEEAEIRKFGFELPPCYEVPNGVNAPEDVCDTSRDPDTLLFLGRLDWKKGLDRLIAAVAMLDGTRLIVAGNDEVGYTGELKAQCERLGISRRVEFVGRVEGADKWRLYRRAAAFVLPSLSENLANTVLEAMATECPVVITPEVGLAPVVTGHGTGVVCRGEPAVLADAIRGVLGDRGRARIMGRNGRRVTERFFSWGPIAASMESAYEEIIGARRARKYA